MWEKNAISIKYEFHILLLKISNIEDIVEF